MGESGAWHTEFYDTLDELRKIRNRVHIQNTKRHFELDDQVAFERRLTLSEQALELVMQTMAIKCARPQHNFARDFKLPWSADFPC